MRVRRVGAAVGIDADAAMGQISCLVGRCGDGHVKAVPGAGIDKCLFAAQRDGDAAPSEPLRGQRHQRLIHGILLVAKATAQKRLYHPHIAERHSDGLSDVAPQRMGHLIAGVHHHAATVHIRKTGVVFQVAGVHRGHRVMLAAQILPTRNFFVGRECTGVPANVSFRGDRKVHAGKLVGRTECVHHVIIVPFSNRGW